MLPYILAVIVNTHIFTHKNWCGNGTVHAACDETHLWVCTSNWCSQIPTWSIWWSCLALHHSTYISFVLCFSSLLGKDTVSYFASTHWGICFYHSEYVFLTFFFYIDANVHKVSHYRYFEHLSEPFVLFRGEEKKRRELRKKRVSEDILIIYLFT